MAAAALRLRDRARHRPGPAVPSTRTHGAVRHGAPWPRSNARPSAFADPRAGTMCPELSSWPMPPLSRMRPVAVAGVRDGRVAPPRVLDRTTRVLLFAGGAADAVALDCLAFHGCSPLAGTRSGGLLLFDERFTRCEVRPSRACVNQVCPVRRGMALPAAVRRRVALARRGGAEGEGSGCSVPPAELDLRACSTWNGPLRRETPFFRRDSPHRTGGPLVPRGTRKRGRAASGCSKVRKPKRSAAFHVERPGELTPGRLAGRWLGHSPVGKRTPLLVPRGTSFRRLTCMEGVEGAGAAFACST